MIGNDIIDLHLAEQESNIRRRGFLDKLFLPAEQDIIAAAAQPAAMVWLLWSCKEAVYKIIHRYSRKRLYAPHHYACALQEVAGTAGISKAGVWVPAFIPRQPPVCRYWSRCRCLPVIILLPTILLCCPDVFFIKTPTEYRLPATVIPASAIPFQ